EGIEWRVHLEWESRLEGLRVESRCCNTVRNISDGNWHARRLWLTRSLPGTPGSHFMGLDAHVRHPDRGKKWGGKHSLTPNRQQLLRMEVPEADGSVVIPERHFSHSLVVPPGGVYDLSATGVTYQPALGGLPLASSHPALKHTLTISGPALNELNV